MSIIISVLSAPYVYYCSHSTMQVCGDVAGLASWTQAMAFFFQINKDVLPLKSNLAVQAVKLEQAQTELNTAQQVLDEKQRELDAVQTLYDNAVR